MIPSFSRLLGTLKDNHFVEIIDHGLLDRSCPLRGCRYNAIAEMHALNHTTNEETSLAGCQIFLPSILGKPRKRTRLAILILPSKKMCILSTRLENRTSAGKVTRKKTLGLQVQKLLVYLHPPESRGVTQSPAPIRVEGL
jgi:hypothetical protein